ncbi:MAG: Crp/Fnr family transcriptional regulator [Clostridiales bacterium]|jgi:CRP-like cAMP-binding protein|nr:Crp/Fnr family transcriptional regulator [Clostridiales bacterium]
MLKQKLPAQYTPALAEYGLDWLDLSATQLIRYERGEWMLLAEQEIPYLYILLSGKAKVCMSDESGRNLLLCYYVSEGIMGDIELMMGRREAISSVQAVSPVVCIGLPLHVYANELLSHLPFVLRVAKGLSVKLHASVSSTTEIILRPFEARLGTYLLHGAQGGVFSERLTDVSEQLGVSYRHLLRSLKALCEEGLLGKRPDGYHILNVERLREKAAR